ncbi:MAG: hypothetical protein AB7O52_10080 [Planctomycetota bacterium]
MREGLTLIAIIATLLPSLTRATSDGILHSVEAKVVNVTPDGVYIDAGRRVGLSPGDSGRVLRDGREVARVEVVLVTTNSARLRVITTLDPSPTLPGDEVELGASSPATEPSELEPPSPPPDRPPPLLAPPRQPTSRTESRNVVHGNVRLRADLQHDAKSARDAARFELASRGRVDRIDGTPWAIEWSWSASLRDGHAYDRTDPTLLRRFDLYTLEVTRPLGGDTFVGFGRFLPRELPAVGYVDGGRIEHELNESWRIGGILGLVPDRGDLGFSAREPLAVAYVTHESVFSGRDRYSGTLGVLGSAYRGKADRLSVLLDQNLSYRKVRVFSSSTFDTDVGGAETRNGIRVTELYTSAHYDAWGWLALRASVEHHERPDNQAERHVFAIDFDRLFDQGFWRYSVGSSQSLPYRLLLDEQVSVIHGADATDDPSWVLSLTKAGIPAWSDAQVTVSVFNYVGETIDGYGGRLLISLPFSKGRVSLQSGCGFRFLETQPVREDGDITDVFLSAIWRVDKNWSADTRVSYSTGGGQATTAAQLGVTFRW